MVGLVAVVALGVVVVGAGSAEAKEPTAPPPITVPPPAGEATPPADAIVDTVSPIQPCSGWYRASDYAGRWATDATWWEYFCASGGGASNQSMSYYTDHYYYDWIGARSVHYGTWFTESEDSAFEYETDPCSYWRDATTGQSYGPYACTRETNALPIADLAVTCSGLSCTFDATGSTDSDGTIVDYLVYFGDDSAANGATLEHSYARAGTYTAALRVVDDGGLNVWTATQVTVGGPAPSAEFVVDCSGPSCVFDAGASTGGDATIAGYAWDFGDGSTATGKTTQHTYAAPGGYTVTLTVTDGQGVTDTTSKMVAVESPPPPPPNAAPTADFSVSCSGLSCSLDGSGSSDADGTIHAYSWNFGDDSTGAGSGESVQHAYAVAATYTVRLIVTDDDGATDGATKAITPIALTARGYKVKGALNVDLSWNGHTGASFDVYRDGQPIATTVTGNSYTDKLNRKRSGAYSYKVCETAGSICSSQAAVTL